MPIPVPGVFVDNSNDMNGPSPAFYSCSWFERKANKENVFPEESLKRIETDNA